ncbi:MAG: PorP/SprF family type IX secretion system membrane protein [Bacteroidota bacterium]
MKKFYFLIAALLCHLGVFAQQEQQYTQFMYNKLGLNPAYAGAEDALTFTGIYRNQWMGLEGAPVTQVLNVNAPLLNRRLGLGLNISHHTIGILERWTINASYAYRVRMGRGNLGIGVQGSARFVGMDYNDPRLKATQDITTDGGIPVGDQSRVVPNFGAGLYYDTPHFYFGLSAPRLITNDIDFNSIDGIVARESEHVFMMTGLILDVNDLIQLNPQVLIKYSPDVPLDADVNLSFIFAGRYTAGVTYRSGGSVDSFGESIDLLLAAKLSEHWLFGVSYDVGLTELRDYHNGSMEGVLRYSLGQDQGNDIINPRFF